LANAGRDASCSADEVRVLLARRVKPKVELQDVALALVDRIFETG
jgi:hypothetical protein